MTDFHVTQHDRKLLAATVASITGEAVEVGTTHLEFLATLTPATSGGVRFLLHGDGHIEAMSARCAGCGRTVSGGEVAGYSSSTDRYHVLHAVTTQARTGALRRVLARLFGCGSCSPQALTAFLMAA